MRKVGLNISNTILKSKYIVSVFMKVKTKSVKSKKYVEVVEESILFR